jgi:hypothetical protein
MALPIREYVLDTGLKTALEKARAVRSMVTMLKADIDGGQSIAANRIIDTMRGVKVSRDIFATVAALPGLAAYAKTEYADANLDIVAELNAVITACDNCVSWVGTNFPKDANGYLLIHKIVAGDIEVRTFAPAALSGFATQLGALLAAFS